MRKRDGENPRTETLLSDELPVEVIDNVTERVIELAGSENPELIAKGLNLALLIQHAVRDVFKKDVLLN